MHLWERWLGECCSSLLSFCAAMLANGLCCGSCLVTALSQVQFRSTLFAC